MSIVVVERSFAEPVEFDGVLAPELAECMRRRGVRASYSLLSRDRHHLVCVHEAPDAESVRVTQDEHGLPYVRVWSAAPLAVPQAVSDPRYELIVVQRELPEPISRELAELAARDPDGCHRRNRCTLLASLISLDGRQLLCRYSAPDAEAVRNANVQAAVPFTRAWVATVIGEVG
ncbi:MAG TPA: nickel-binding protein [Polyangiales bacterium]|nr:nickel-binding protein [Polyangiales bacterium]